MVMGWLQLPSNGQHYLPFKKNIYLTKCIVDDYFCVKLAVKA